MRVSEAMQKELTEQVQLVKVNVEENYQIPGELLLFTRLALYHNGSFQRFIGGMGTRAEILKQLRLEKRD